MSIFDFNSARENQSNEQLLRLAAQVDEFEAYLHPHATRIAKIADLIAESFDLPQHERQNLQQAALIHDLGEAVMNRDYIKRGGLLGEDERLDMMRHPVIGEQAAAQHGLSRAVQLLVRWHQEWWNGEGYPDNLRREQIPLAARILRVADSYAALTDHRPYSPAVSAEEARKHLTHWAALEFDPRVVAALLRLPAETAALQSFADSESAPPLIRRVFEFD